MMFRLNCYFPAEGPIYHLIETDSNTRVKMLLKAVEAELKEEDRTDLKLKTFVFSR